MDLFEEVRTQISVSGVYALLTGDDAQANAFTKCPICDSPRLQIGSRNTSWTCWAGRCHEAKGSDVVGMAASAWKLDRAEAARRLLEEKGLYRGRGENKADGLDRFDVRTRKRPESSPRAVSDDPPILKAWQSPEWQAWISGIVEQAHADLLDWADPRAKDAQRYLRKERGIDGETARTHRIGLVHQWLHTHGVLPGKKAIVAPGLLIPWAKPGGGYCGAIVREFHEPLKSKYVMVSGSSRRWAFPGPIVHETDAFDRWGYTGPLLVTEGEIDALTAQRALAGLVAVKTIGSATSGPDALDPAEKLTLAGFTKIIVAADSDKSGQECRDMWRAYSPRAVSLTLPEGHKDLNAAYVAGVDLRAWLVSELDRLGVSLSWEPGVDDETGT